MKIEVTEPDVPDRIEVQHVWECGSLQEFCVHASVAFGTNPPTIWWVDGRALFFTRRDPPWYRKIFRKILNKEVLDTVYHVKLEKWEPIVKVGGMSIPIRKGDKNPLVNNLTRKLFNEE